MSTHTTSGASGFFSSFRLKSADKNWRGKYLRALNICPREGEVHRKRAVTDGGGTRRARPHQQAPPQPTAQAIPTPSGVVSVSSRSSRSHSSGPSSSSRRPAPSRDDDVGSRTRHLQAALAARHGAVPTERRHHEPPSVRRPIHSNSSSNSNSSSTTTRNSFGVVRKPSTSSIQRNKQPSSEPLFALDERVSGPISIPTPTRKSSAISIGKVSDLDGGLNKLGSRTSSHYNLDNNRKHGSQLLSWEEPLAMMAAAGAVSAGLPMDQSTTAKLGIDNSLYDMYDNYVDECGDTEEEDDDDDKDTEADDLFDEGAMFEMEDFDNEFSNNNNSNNDSKVQRRRRSSSLVGSNQRPNLLPRPHSVRQISTNKDLFGMQTLPESFVPPHQMIERDCFSIGLRDQLKRRPSGRI